MSDHTPDTIVLIHGLWMSPLAWEHSVTRYEERGYTVLTLGIRESGRAWKRWRRCARILT
jgi:alpha-beta hydrolase superfamily lysophospholipase